MLWFTLMALSAAWIVYPYVGYPLLLSFWARRSPRTVSREEQSAPPSISVIIAVHNGAGVLRHKLESTLTLAFEGERQIIVASDGSTDDTHAIAMEFASRGVELVALEARAGKEAAQAAAIAKARGEILVFTDVGAELEPDALRRIVEPFADAGIACVSSEDRVDSEGGEGAYVRLEMALRRLESEASSLVGLSGSFFAIRRELGTPWPTDLASDFRCALEANRRGLRAVSEPRAQAHFVARDDPAAEWHRKVRTVRRGIAVLMAHRDLLHPRYGRTAVSLWSHKVMRFTAPFALALLGLSTAAAATLHPLAQLCLAAELLGLVLGTLALRGGALARIKLARLLGFFLLVNASMLTAWGYHLLGRRAVAWTPTKR